MDILKKVFQSITIPSIQGYDFDKDCIITVGQWRIYNAKNKQRLGSVWICDQSKQFQIAKKEYTSFIKLKYPGILQVLEPLVEEKSYIGFVTERIETTLTQILNDQKYTLSDIEMKLHLLEIVDGLQFLHNSVRQVHLDIQPDKIFITDSGKWKIAGSQFQQQILNNTVDCQIPYGSYNLAYTAPEIISQKPQCAYVTDVFSLGMIILRLMRFRNNRVAFPEGQDQDSYLKFIKNLDLMRYKDIFPEKFLNFLTQMLCQSIQNRPNLSQFVQIDWFKDPYLITFNILNKLPEYDMQQQIVFFKGLSSVIFNFEKSILKKRLLPIVLGLTQYDHLLTPIVQIILETMRREDIINSQQFQQEIWPKLKQIISGKEIPAQVLYDLVLALPVFHKYISQKEIQEHLIPLLIKCYECKVPKLQDLGIRVTEFVLENNDYTFSKTKILPRIFVLALDQNIEIRKTTLICIYKTLNVMDSDQVLTALEKVKSSGTDRQLNQIVLKIYQSLSKSLNSDQIAQKLLPQITPYLTDPTLSKAEFNEYFDTLQQMLTKIKNEKEKILNESVQTLVQVDYKLALPEPKRIQESKNDQFEFLNQFDQRLSSIPDKPNIAENIQKNTTDTPPQPAQPIVQQQQQQNNNLQIGQPMPIGTPINSPFPVSIGLSTNQQQSLFQQPAQQNSSQFQVGFTQPYVAQPNISIPQNDNFNFYTPTPQLNMTDPFSIQTQTQPQNSSSIWQPQVQTQQQTVQQIQQEQKKLSTRPLFQANNQVVSQNNTQSQIKQDIGKVDPWATYNQQQTVQDPWASFQNPVIQNQPQNIWDQSTKNQGFQLPQTLQQQPQVSNKSKYASFDELI